MLDPVLITNAALAATLIVFVLMMLRYRPENMERDMRLLFGFLVLDLGIWFFSRHQVSFTPGERQAAEVGLGILALVILIGGMEVAMGQYFGDDDDKPNKRKK